MLPIGHILPLSGYVTLQRFIQGRSVADIERVLRFRKGILREGLYFAVATILPDPDQFELVGYAHQLVYGRDRVTTPMEENLNAEEALTKVKMDARAHWSLDGALRLVMVFPEKGSTPSGNKAHYLPSYEVPQWNILEGSALPFRIIARLDGSPEARFKPDDGFMELF